MRQTLARLQAQYPALRFTPGQEFCWSPETQEIFYKKGASGQRAIWSLLHETGHALLKHTSYRADFELIRLEVAAWGRARQLGQELAIEIKESHIQDCLDTYRDWLYKRSICPSCGTKCLQQGDIVHYRCFNCHTVWGVTDNRFCRAYRSTKNIPQSSTLHLAASF